MTRPPVEARGAIAKLFVNEPRPREILIDGPAGTGKSFGILHYLKTCALRYDGSRILMARKVRATLAESIMVTWEQMVLEPWSEAQDRLSRTGRTKPYRFDNGSEIVPFGFDDREKIKSTEFDMIYVNEANELSLDDWEYAVGRLRHNVMPYQQALADCNPDHPNHWLLRRCEDGRMTRWPSRHHDNPAYYDEQTGEWTDIGRDYVLGTLGQLTGVRRSRLLSGLWVAAEGTVFEDSWDEQVHRPQTYPRDRIRWYIGGIDWGWRHPGAMLVWGVDDEGRMWRVREVYHTLRNPDWWTWQAKCLQRDFAVRCWVPDPSQPGFIDKLSAEGLNMVKLDKGGKDIVSGLRLIDQRLLRRQLFYVRESTGWYDREGHWIRSHDPYLREHGKPTCTEAEYSRYAYPKNEEGKPIKEKPVPEYDDGIDATRYAVVFTDYNDLTPPPDARHYEHGTFGAIDGRRELEHASSTTDPFGRAHLLKG